MQNFKLYSQYYDLLYEDKDYIAEANYIADLINTYRPHSKSILELGSGTGKHAFLLAEQGYKILGLERSADMVAIANHPFGPTYKQLVFNTKILIKKYKLSKIFIVTEDPKSIEVLEEHFPKMVFYTDSYRSKKGNAYKELKARKNHRYYLGLEILRDAHLLAQCGGILYSDSNVNEYSRLINNYQYKFRCEIKNGTNSPHHIYSKFKYNIIKRLPKHLGGLRDEVVITEKT